MSKENIFQRTTSSPSILALIPARGGSRGIPKKNIVSLAGKPLIAYSIEQAKSSRFINRIMVSTDDKEIAAIAKKYGAEVPFIRPKKFARDFSPDISVFKHALKWLKDTEAYQPDLIVHLRPTCPIRKKEIIDMAIRKMIENPEADSLRSVSLASQTPYKMWRISKGYLRPLLSIKGMKESFNLPRQQLPPVFWQNGYIDITRPRNIIKRGVVNGTKIIAFLIEDETVDIDYKESLIKAEKMLKQMKKSAGVSAAKYREKKSVSKWSKRHPS